MTLLEFLALNWGGMSPAKRLVQVRAVKLKRADDEWTVPPHLADVILTRGDLIQVGKHWSVSII